MARQLNIAVIGLGGLARDSELTVVRGDVRRTE